jgi:hypothetical protein
MSWRKTDEYIDLVQSRHVVEFRNSDLGPDAPPHLLVNHFQLPKCPHCGTIHAAPTGDLLDFEAVKEQELAKLNAHYKQVLQYKERYTHVRIKK